MTPQKVLDLLNEYPEVTEFCREMSDACNAETKGMRWIKASERLPVIDNKKPKHYLFQNDVNHHAINIWTEFIRDFPPMITVNKLDWEWLDETPAPLNDWVKVDADEKPKQSIPIVLELTNKYGVFRRQVGMYQDNSFVVIYDNDEEAGWYLTEYVTRWKYI